MALRRLLGVSLLVLGTSLGLVAPASADPYGPEPGSASVNRTVVKQGQVVNVRGDGFCPGATVTITVSADGEQYIRKEVFANRNGVANTRLSLTRLGENVIKLSGCQQGGGRQVLTAEVRVVPWPGRAHAGEKSIDKGERIAVRGARFCRNAPVVVTVHDDGKRYKRKVVQSNARGVVKTSVKLTRVGRTSIVMSGCRSEGWKQQLRTKVRVHHAGSASMSPTGFVRAATDRTPGGTPVAAAGALLVAFVAGHGLATRRRSRRAQI